MIRRTVVHPSVRGALVVSLMTLFVACASCAAGTSPDGSVFKVRSIQNIRDYAKSVDWSQANGLIASAKLGDDGYFDVMVLDPDSDWEQCLTCNKSGIPQKHIGNPCWHPSGEYIVFTAEKADVPDMYDYFAIPGKGLNNDLYIMTSDGSTFWKLHEVDYSVDESAKGVIHPQFSHDGSMLLWAERLGADTDERHNFGEWALKLSDFAIADGEPYVSNIRTIQPGGQAQFYETHAFSPDDAKVLFCGNLISGQLPTGMDIYEYSIADGTLRQLTVTYDDWDEHAHYSPDGTVIAWMSSTGFYIEYDDIDRWADDLITELWIMNADGSEKTRLTHFNDPGYPEHTGTRTIVSDSSWSPEGDRLIMAVTYEDNRGRLRYRELVMIELQ